jgi:hypothetical protein
MHQSGFGQFRLLPGQRFLTASSVREGEIDDFGIAMVVRIR